MCKEYSQCSTTIIRLGLAYLHKVVMQIIGNLSLVDLSPVENKVLSSCMAPYLSPVALSSICPCQVIH